MTTKRFSIHIAGLSEEKWNQCMKEFHRESFIHLPDDITINFDKLSIPEQLIMVKAMSLAVAIYSYRINLKRTEGN